MANTTVFNNNLRRYKIPTTDCINEAGAKAYSLSPEQSLAQYAVTGVFNNTFYTSAKSQLDKILALVGRVPTEFIGKLAVYARQYGNMKDVPAFLVASLVTREDGDNVFKTVFPRVINDGRMLRNFVQIMRSGVLGRKSLGSMAKKAVASWFVKRDGNKIFTNSIGNDPSFIDILKLAHVRPPSKEHEATFAYLMGKIKEDGKSDLIRYLPSLIQEYEAYKANPCEVSVPAIPFQFIASLDIPERAWSEIAKSCSWQTLRMNLNTFERHGVLKDTEMVKSIAKRLVDAEEIQKSKVFPYQLFTAYKNTKCGSLIGNALQDALDASLVNIPNFGENVFVCTDVSGSMSSPITGDRGSATSDVTCIEVAGLISSAILRKNQNATVIPFENRIRMIQLNARDSVMTNAEKLANIGGGGTNCSAALEEILRSQSKVDTVIYVSDNQSWMDDGAWGGASDWGSGQRGTNGIELWEKVKRLNPKAKLICINLQPNMNTQFKEREDILNIGGFSDTVFSIIDSFVNMGNNWVETINKIEL